MDKIQAQLGAWILSLDKQIGDTEKEIEKRRQDEHHAVSFRDDLRELMSYLSTHELPAGAQRALLSCLAWNPHAKN